jgi:hypothetical protein
VKEILFEKCNVQSLRSVLHLRIEIVKKLERVESGLTDSGLREERQRALDVFQSYAFLCGVA